MYQPDFSGCLAKLDRAEQHSKELDAYLTKQFSITTNLPTLSAEYDSQSASHIFRISFVPPLDTILIGATVRLGDVVQNLRACLDHLTYQLALFHTNGNIKNPRGVYFPYARRRKLFTGYIDARGIKRGGHIDHCLAEVATKHHALIKRFQPYHAVHGKRFPYFGPFIHPLAMLDDLSIRDKHRLLNVVAATSQIFKGTPELEAIFLANLEMHSPLNLFGGWQGQLKTGAEYMRLRLPAGYPSKMDMAGHLVPRILLPKRRPIISEVERLSASVLEVVQTVVKSF